MTNQILKSLGFYGGRMIAASKSEYRKKHPDNLVVFNATIVTETGEAFVMMDLDLTLDDEKLQQARNQIGEFCVLRESDAWDLSLSYEQLKEKAVKVYV